MSKVLQVVLLWTKYNRAFKTELIEGGEIYGGDDITQKKTRKSTTSIA